MRVSRLALALLAVLTLSLALTGTALADKSERKAEKEARNRGLHGVVISSTANSFKLDLKKADSESGDDVTVLVQDGARLSMPGGKRLSAALFTSPQWLQAGDRVNVRGHWTNREKNEFTATAVALTGKTVKRFGGKVTAVSSSSITVEKHAEDDEVITKTFSLSGAVVLPSGTTPAVGDQVRVVFRKGTTTALGVLVKKD